MANAKIGSQTSWNQNYVESITTTKQLAPGDSGKLFMIDSSTTYTVNLPKLSADIAGWNCKMILKTAGGSKVSVVAYGLPAAGGAVAVSDDAETVNFMDFEVLGSSDGASPTDKDGFGVETGATVNDNWDIITDGTTWYIKAFLYEVEHSNSIDTD